MSTEAEELHRIISTSVRDMLDAYRIQASAGPVTDKALEEILFRAAHGVVQSLATYPGPQRVALLPSVVRMLLATFLEDVAKEEGEAFAVHRGHLTLLPAHARHIGRRREHVGAVGALYPRIRQQADYMASGRELRQSALMPVGFFACGPIQEHPERQRHGVARLAGPGEG
jgi:hypothetical protein